MHRKTRHRVVMAVLLGLLPVGSAPTMAITPGAQLQHFKKGLAYEPVAASTTLSARVGLDTAYKLSPEARAIFKSAQLNDEHIALWETAVAEAMFEDFVGAKLFWGVARDKAQADLLLVLRGRDYAGSGATAGFRLQLSCAVQNARTGGTVAVYEQDKPYIAGVMDSYKAALREGLGQIRAAMATDFKDQDLTKLSPTFVIKPKPQETVATAADPASTPALSELLVAKEISAAGAQQRTRALIAFKTLLLPQLLREKKTAELTALTVQIEQLILDLNHEAELEKDRAQRAAELNPNAIEEHRELAIVYRQRIEVLKPIGAAIKEEIANRAK